MIEELKRRIVEGGSITPKEAEALASVPERDALCDAADEIRRHFCGNEIDTCSIANARSGKCGEDCKWCAQSKHFSTGVKEYERIGTTQLVQLAQGYDRIGVNRFSLVTSGRKVAPKDAAAFCDDYKLLAKETTLSLCASMGLVDEDTLRALKAAGVSRYHCNMETSSEFFPSLCTTHTPDDKRRVIRAARAAGMTVCSGGIIGMGETMSDRIQMAFELRALKVDSVPINILNPIKGTPLGKEIRQYSFFAYSSSEALHLSLAEREVFMDCLGNIQAELLRPIDRHSRRLISRNIELLLDYCMRFYERQFISRAESNRDVLTRFEALLDEYFRNELPESQGLPSVKYFAGKVCLSPNYFGDLVKKETGRSPQEYIQDKIIDLAKEKILGTEESINEIAYGLGFQYSQHFTRVFKRNVGVTPSEYRRAPR